MGIFPIPIAYWSGFGIFKQNQDNLDEIWMAGQSVHCAHGQYFYMSSITVDFPAQTSSSQSGGVMSLSIEETK